MPGKGKAPASGSSFRDQVAEKARSLGLRVIEEVSAARRIWGPKRKIDLVLIHQESGKRLGVECKFQEQRGTAEEKILATIQDITSWPIPGIVVISGKGFSREMESYLLSTGKVVFFSDLEDWLRLYFGL